MRFVPLYLKEKKYLHRKLAFDDIKAIVNRNIKNVPAYSDYNLLVASDVDLSRYPIIRKKDIIEKERSFVSKRFNSRMLRQVETGGSTGISLKLFRSIKSTIKDIAFTDYIFSKIGDNLSIAVLRGQKPKSGFYEKLTDNYFILSSYMINEDLLDSYIKILSENKISCIHAYPSSLVVFARLIKQKYGRIDLPHLKGILTSSETFSSQERDFVRGVFENNVIMIDYYSQNEQVCCAYSINGGPYVFPDNFGYVEFVDTGEKLDGNIIYEIVATSVMNDTMPFIRYGTEDYVTLDKAGNVVSIIGRSSDFVVNKNLNVVPCIVLTRNVTLKNVTNFQYFQEKPGNLVFRVKVTQNFSSVDKNYIIEDFVTSFNGLMDCTVEIVQEIEKTKAGKQRRLVQKLDISKYK